MRALTCAGSQGEDAAVHVMGGVMMKSTSFGAVLIAVSMLAGGCAEEAQSRSADGEPCANSNECATGACLAGVCKAGSCERDSHCDTGQICRFADGAGTCTSLCTEGQTQACTNNCGNGTETCSRGVWVGCDAPLPEAEVCNGIDDDCNGTVDDVAGCVGDGDDPVDDPVDDPDDDPIDNPGGGGEGEGEVVDPNPGGEGEGEGEVDNAGEGEGEPVIDCTPTDPPTEVCDGVDNDCDGTEEMDGIDNALEQECATACEIGTEQCVQGEWVGCTARNPLDGEICGNGVDDDCDDETDEVAECPPECVARDVILCDGLSQDCEPGDEYPSPAELAALDPREPNDDCTCDGNRNLGDNPNFEHQGLLYIGDNDDYFCFHGDDPLFSAPRIRVNLSFVPPGTNYDLFFYEGDDNCRNNNVKFSSTNAGQGVAESIDEEDGLFGTSLGSGRHWVRVKRTGGFSCNEQYSLSIHWEP